MKVGDKVQIVKSPYSVVPVGSVGTIARIRRKHFCDQRRPDYDGYALYEVSGLEYKNFRFWDLRKINL